jgi:hypothetical protein
MKVHVGADYPEVVGTLPLETALMYLAAADVRSERMRNQVNLSLAAFD